MKAADIKAALAVRHGANGGSGEWVVIEEAFCGWASAGGGVDLLAIGAWRTAKAPGLPGAGRLHGHWRAATSIDARHPVVAYEVKVSRSDFRRELYGYTPGPNASWRTRQRGGSPPWPNKAHFALERSHFFLFAIPKGLLRDEEVERREKPHDDKGLWLPPEAGLIEVDGRGCHVRVNAPRRKARALTVPETAELLRHGIDPNRERKLREETARLRQDSEFFQRRLASCECEA